MPPVLRKACFLLATLICISVSVPAQTSDTCNRTLTLVLQTARAQPIWPATVFVPATGQSVEADSTGTALLRGLCGDKAVFRILTADYPTFEDSVMLTGLETRKTLTAAPEKNLREVLVERKRLETPLQSTATLGTQEIQAVSGLGLAQTLSQINGVTTISNGATVAKTVIHGLSGNRVATFNNGVRQEDQQWGGEHAPAIDPFVAGSMTVVKGAAGVRYGTDALAGVVLIEPAPLRQAPGWNGAVGLTAASNNRMGVLSAQVEHRFRKLPQWVFRIQGTLKAAGNYQLPSGSWAANTGLREQNLSATLDWRKNDRGASLFYSRFYTEIGLYRGSHTGSQTDLLNAINSPEPLVPASFTYALARPFQAVEHHLVKARAFRENRFGIWSATYAFQHNFRQEYDVVRTPTDAAQLNLTLQTQTLNLNLDLHPKNGFSGTIGLDGLWQRNRFADGDRLFIPFYDALSGGGYAIGKYRKSGWEVEAGLRGDLRHYHMLTNQGTNQQVVAYDLKYQNLSGTAAVRRVFTPRLEGSLTLARSWRAPQANELFAAGLHQGAARIELGNANLKPEAATGLSAALQWKSSNWEAEVSAYRQWISDFIFLQPGPDLLTIRGYYKTFRYQQTDALLSGMDASVGGSPIKHVQVAAKASLLRTRDRRRNDWIILMPADRLESSIRYERDLGRWKDVYVGVSAAYVARQKRIPEDFDRMDYPRPPAAYTVLSATAGLTLPATHFPGQLSLMVENLLNRSYREYLDAFRYFLDRPGRNFILRLHVPLGKPAV